MASRLTVIFYILLCLEAGVFLTLLPWWQPWGMGDWGDNFFLVMVAQKTGLYGLQRAVASGWVRGAVTGVGLLNLAMAFWEIFHFGDTVRRLQGADAAQRQAEALKSQTPASAPTSNETDAANAPTADNLSHHGRRDD
jgi:hypothetical protein